MKKAFSVVLMCGCMLAGFSLPKRVIKSKNIKESAFRIAISNDTSRTKEITYCSSYMQTKYKVLITNNKIRIARLYKEYKDVFTGIIKNGKIYSNDPEEKKIKPVWGKYYKLGKNSFSVLNIENGEYEQFTLCKE